MDKEEIEELKEFTIDLTDIDELALGLEICSKKSNMVIQEFIDTIVQLQQENKQVKERINKAIEYIRSNDIEVLKYHDIPSETTSYEIVTVDLLKILRGGENDRFKTR